MAMESWKQAIWQLEFISIADFFFTFVFGFECMFKMWAFTPRRYYASGWNRFDFFIVMISFTGITIDNLGSAVGINPTVLRVLRIFRVFRILRAFRIFKAARGLQEIIATLVSSLPAIVNLFCMLALLFFIYGVLGVTIFGSLCISGDEARPGLKATQCLFTAPNMLLDSHANFRGVGWSILTLFRVATGDAWGSLLESTQLQAHERKVTQDMWDDLVALYGEDPSLLPVTDRNHVMMNMSNAAQKIAAISIRRWNESSYGLDESVEWPFPNNEAFEWVLLARRALPGCLTDEDARFMEKAGLSDCSVDGYVVSCKSTCGDSFGANLYFVSFVCVATFILLQLVIAVLMEQLANNDHSQAHVDIVPGCTVLAKPVFARVYRRWRYNAARKLRLERRRARLEEEMRAKEAAENGIAVSSPGNFVSGHTTPSSNKSPSWSPLRMFKRATSPMRAGDAEKHQQSDKANSNTQDEGVSLMQPHDGAELSTVPEEDGTGLRPYGKYLGDGDRRTEVQSAYGHKMMQADFAESFAIHGSNSAGETAVARETDGMFKAHGGRNANHDHIPAHGHQARAERLHSMDSDDSEHSRRSNRRSHLPALNPRSRTPTLQFRHDPFPLGKLTPDDLTTPRKNNTNHSDEFERRESRTPEMWPVKLENDDDVAVQSWSSSGSRKRLMPLPPPRTVARGTSPMLKHSGSFTFGTDGNKPGLLSEAGLPCRLPMSPAFSSSGRQLSPSSSLGALTPLPMLLQGGAPGTSTPRKRAGWPSPLLTLARPEDHGLQAAPPLAEEKPSAQRDERTKSDGNASPRDAARHQTSENRDEHGVNTGGTPRGRASVTEIECAGADSSEDEMVVERNRATASPISNSRDQMPSTLSALDDPGDSTATP